MRMRHEGGQGYLQYDMHCPMCIIMTACRHMPMCMHTLAWVPMYAVIRRRHSLCGACNNAGLTCAS